MSVSGIARMRTQRNSPDPESRAVMIRTAANILLPLGERLPDLETPDECPCIMSGEPPGSA